MNGIITLEQNSKDAYERKLKKLYSDTKVNGTREEKSLQTIISNQINVKAKKIFGIESNMKMVHINLTSILFSMNKLNFMKNIFKRKDGLRINV